MHRIVFALPLLILVACAKPAQLDSNADVDGQRSKAVEVQTPERDPTVPDPRPKEVESQPEVIELELAVSVRHASSANKSPWVLEGVTEFSQYVSVVDAKDEPVKDDQGNVKKEWRKVMEAWFKGFRKGFRVGAIIEPFGDGKKYRICKIIRNTAKTSVLLEPLK